MASFIIDELSKHVSVPLGYFYCKHKVSGKNDFKAALRSLLAQFLRLDESLLSYVYDEYLVKDDTKINSTPVLEELLRLALTSQRLSFVVLDGLDECDQEEEEKIIDWFQSLAKPSDSKEQGTIRLLCIGQRDGIMDRMLSGAVNLSFDDDGHQQDIIEFSDELCRKIQRKFNVPLSDREKLSKDVTTRAKGVKLSSVLGYT